MRTYVIALSVGCVGCSFVFVPAPPSDPSERTREAASRCTTSVLHPVLDSVGAGIGAINIGIAADASPGDVSWYGIEMDAEKGMGLGVTQLVVFGAAAAYGFIQISRCDTLREETRGMPQGPTWSPVLSSEPVAPPPAPPPSVYAPAPSPSAQAPPPAPQPQPQPPPTPTASPDAPPAAPAKPSVPTVSFPDE